MYHTDASPLRCYIGSRHAEGPSRSRRAQEGEDQRVATLRRAWGFARAYHWHLAVYLGTIGLAALVGTLLPLIFKPLIDGALPPATPDGCGGLDMPFFISSIVGPSLPWNCQSLAAKAKNWNALNGVRPACQRS